MPSFKAPLALPASLPMLQEKANHIREQVITMLLAAGSGHSAGSLGMADVFTALYFHIARHNPHQPDWPERDFILLSNGHICPVWYATLAEAGYFDPVELSTLRKLDSRLQGHPHRHTLPGIENTSGPLALGLSQAAGLALSLRLRKAHNRVFCLMSDGEHQEGQNWEAYMLAGHYKLANLTVLIDRNNIQIDGETEDIMSLQPLKHKIEAFNWQVLDIDGHDFDQIISACKQAERTTTSPTAIICNTTPGKGVAFMENQYQWHGKPPNRAEASNALQFLRSLGDQIRWD